MNKPGNKKKVVAVEFASLLKEAEENKKKSKAKKKQNQEFDIFTGMTFTNNDQAKDYNFECGCFGTKHGVINNCLTCGRVICELEGERPCPYCGTPVFSDATLQDPERLLAVEEEMKAKISSEKWVPISQKDLQVSVEPPTVSTKMYDLETDWFDSEIVQVFDSV